MSKWILYILCVDHCIQIAHVYSSSLCLYTIFFVIDCFFFVIDCFLFYVNVLQYYNFLSPGPISTTQSEDSPSLVGSLSVGAVVGVSVGLAVVIGVFVLIVGIIVMIYNGYKRSNSELGLFLIKVHL